ncbi:MAG TPA: metallophosphoesterase [Segetibacter sp.]|jgi:hypothetical protein
MIKPVLKWGGLFAAGVAIANSLVLDTCFFETNTFDIGNNEQKKKITLLLLTDVHLKKTLSPLHEKLAKRVHELQPDIILIAGDLIDKHGVAEPAEKFMAMLPQSIPKMGIMGNHDHKSEVSLQHHKQLYAQNNGVLLVNESRKYSVAEHHITVTGLDDYIEGEASLADAVANVGREENHILLIHSPKQQEKVKKQLKKINKNREENDRLNIQYIFAGHNHGGQVRFFGYAPVMPEKSGKYMNGWYNNTPPFLYVSKGFGTTTLPFRFGAKSEITLLNLWV